MLNFITSNKIPIALIVVFFISIFAYLPVLNIDLRIGRTMIAEWAMICFIALFLIKNVWVKSFCIWGVFSLVIHGFWTGFFDRQSYLTLNVLVFSCIFYQVVYDKLEKKHLFLVINGICILSIIQAIFMILNKFGIYFPFEPIRGGFLPAVGFLDNTNLAGAFLAITIPLFFRKNWSYCLFFLIPAIVLSESFGAVISLTVATLVYLSLILEEKGFLFVCFIFFCSLLFCYFIFFETTSRSFLEYPRIITWEIAINEFASKRPIIGYGIGQWSIVYKAIAPHAAKIKDYNIPKYLEMYAHNEYVQSYIEFGLIGLFFIFGFVCDLFRKLKKDRYSILLYCCIIACLVNALFNFIFHITTALIIIVYFAMYEKSLKEN